MTVFVGPNSSGKSNLIHALDLFFNGAAEGESSDCVRRTERGQAKYCTIKVTFDDVPDGVRQQTEQIAGKSRTRKDLPLIVRYEDGTRYVEAPSLAQEGSEQARAIERLLLTQMRFVRVPPIRDADRDLSLAEGSVLRKILDVLFDEPRGPGRPREVFRRFTRVFNDVLTELKRLSGDIEKMARQMMRFEGVEFAAARPSLVDIVSGIGVTAKDPVETQLADKGTGFQSAFLIAVMRYLAERAREDPEIDLVFAIEEPEAFLHPNAQRAIWAVLEQISQASQVLLTTHSPVLVDRIRWRDFTGVVRVHKVRKAGASSPVTVVRQPVLTELQRQLIKHRSDLRGSEVFFADGVIIVEGPGDRLVYRELAFKEASPLEQDGIVVLEAQGGSFDPPITLCSAYNIPWVILCDKDMVTGQRPVLESLAKHTGLDPVVAQQVRNLAGRSVHDEADGSRVAKQINRLVGQHRCRILTCDLEFALVNEDSIQAVIGTLADPGILGISPQLQSRWHQWQADGRIGELLRDVERFSAPKDSCQEKAVKALVGRSHTFRFASQNAFPWSSFPPSFATR